MDSPRTYWSQWTESLHRMGLDGFAAWLLEAGAPVHILGAQLLYIGQPFVTPQASDGIRALANLLEEKDEARAFAAFLQRSSNMSDVASELDDAASLKGQSS